MARDMLLAHAVRNGGWDCGGLAVPRHVLPEPAARPRMLQWHAPLPRCHSAATHARPLAHRAPPAPRHAGAPKLNVSQVGYSRYVASWINSTTDFTGSVSISINTTAKECDLAIPACSVGPQNYYNARAPRPVNVNFIDSFIYKSTVDCLEYPWQARPLLLFPLCAPARACCTQVRLAGGLCATSCLAPHALRLTLLANCP